ncbi:glycosyltransferase family 2 protein [Chloroflexota bacterium]
MNKWSKPRVIVAMPAYNEEKYIGSIVLQARQFASEVLVIDDGSDDQTSKIAELAGATVVMHQGRKGKGTAIQNIFTAAKKRDPDILVILDADSQHDPNEIPSLITGISEGFDLIIGSRKTQKGHIPGYRRVGQNVLSYFTHIMSRKKLSDTESGFRAFSREAISRIQLKETGFAIETEMIAEAAAKGLRVKEIPISAIYTQDGSTMNPIKHGFGVLNRIIMMISERRPLLFFGLGGSVAITLGIIAGVTVALDFFASGVLAAGTALISALLVTVGMLSIYTGIILNVLVKRISDRL